MSSVRFALEKLYDAVDKLDISVSDVEGLLHAQDSKINDGNVVDIDFVANRLDSAIIKVEKLLEE